MRLLLAAVLAATAALPALADQTEGVVVAFDRKANVIVLEDMTIWPLPSGDTAPADLVAGDHILIQFQGAGENGVGAVTAVTRVAD